MPSEASLVLVVEDDSMMQTLYRLQIEEYAQVIIVGSTQSALQALDSHMDITHVTLDGYVPRFDGQPTSKADTTHDLARLLIEKYPHLKVFTASSDPYLNDELGQIGCIRADKMTAPRMVIDDICK